ncbi:uncharacterized protein LOC134080453 isoform X2 [Sardina pilchardus]|uniref:uncharacterized protein LOC134080453 isoform X2 n=1 Tax=Sardina pilchardus TaxID=27697 RepID=UPI002E143714
MSDPHESRRGALSWAGDPEKPDRKLMKGPGSTVSSGLSMRSDRSKELPPNLPGEGKSCTSMDSGYAPSLSASGISAGQVLCDACNSTAVKECLTCMASYCGTHVKDHYTSPDLERHQLQDLLHQDRCEHHNKKLKFYCKTDQSDVCSRCFLHNHRGHDIIEQNTQWTPSKSGIIRQGVPPPRQIHFTSVKPNSVTVNWSPPEGPPGPYRYKVIRRTGQEKRSFTLETLFLKVAGLTPGEKYYFAVASLSEDGRQSTFVEASVCTEVPPPEHLTVNLMSVTASVKWSEPAGVDQVSYLLKLCRDQEAIDTIQTDLSQHTITDLKHGADYTINVFTVLRNDNQSKPACKAFRTVTRTQHEGASASRSTDVQEQRAKDIYQPNAVVVENISRDLTRDLLGLIVVNIAGVSEDEYTMELIYESRLAVVTFTNPDDVKKFQTEAKRNKKFQNCNMTVRVLERTCSLRMECLPLNANKDLLELYCERQRAEVKNVALIPEENAAVVTFQQPEDIVTMLKTQHKICKIEVRIYPYYKSLGTALYGKDRPRWKIPDSFTVNIHPTLLEFLQKKKLTSHINDRMQAHHCQVSMKSTDLRLSPLPTLLKMKGLTAKHIDGWKENTSDAFHQIMSKYRILEKMMNSDVCSSVAEELLPILQDNVFMKMDSIKGQLTLAGMTKDIDNLGQIVDGIVNKTTSQLERERNSVEQDMDLPADMFKLLQLDGLSQFITASCPQVSLNYKSSSKKLVLSGLNSEVLTVKTWVLEKRMQMKQLPVELDPHIVEFLITVDSEIMSDQLFFSRGIHAIYVIKDRAVVLTGTSDRFMNESVGRMKEMLTFRVLTVEDQEVLRKSEWRTLITEVLSMFNTPRKIPLLKLSSNQPDSLTVSGFIEPVKKASQILQDFLQNHARVVNTVKVKCCAAKRFIEEHKSEEWRRFAKVGEVVVHFDPKRPRIKLSGERTYVKPAVDAFKKMVTSLFIDELKVYKPGAKKFFQEQGSLLLSMMVRDHRCVVLLQDDSMLEEDDDDDDDERNNGKCSTFSDFQQGYYSGSSNHGSGNQWEGERKWQSSSTRSHSERTTQQKALEAMQSKNTPEQVRQVLKKRHIQDPYFFRRANQGESQGESKVETVLGWFSPGRTDEQESDNEFVMVGEEFAPAIFQLCGETSQEVSRAKDCVTSFIMKEQASTQIKDPLINRFTQEDTKELQDLQRELTVSIRREHRSEESVIYLEGLTRDVFKVEGRIRDMIRRAERKETTKGEGKSFR